MSLLTVRAVLLRSFPYSETSRVLRFYTDALGGVGVMGKGIRSGDGKKGMGLETFAEGALTLYTKPTRDLQTLKDFAPVRPRRALASDVARFGGASVLAELVLRHAGEEANPPLFDTLSGALDRVAAVPAKAVLPVVLQEGWRLVSALGYRPAVEACVECGAAPGPELGRFDFAAGGVRCGGCSSGRSGPRVGPGARAQLAGLISAEEPPELDRPRAHLRLLSDFVTWHVSGGRPLPSFGVFAGLLGRDTEEVEEGEAPGGPGASSGA